jgi:hypothetical protein
MWGGEGVNGSFKIRTYVYGLMHRHHHTVCVEPPLHGSVTLFYAVVGKNKYDATVSHDFPK